MARFNSTGTGLVFGSYFGGTEDEGATGGVAVAPNGDMLIAAQTNSTGLATTGSFDETLAEFESFGQDAIIARIGDPADLDLVVTDSPDPVIAGANLTYGITAENLGTADADNTTLIVFIFQSTFVSSTGSCVDNSGVVTCDLGTLAAGGGPGPAPAGASSVSFDLVIQVDPYFNGSTLSHTFYLSADPFDLDLSNNSVTVDTTVELEADLQVTKSDSVDPVLEDDTVVYTVTVTNNGPSGAEGVSLIDEIPTEVTFVSSDSDDTDEICFYEGDLDCFFGDLDPGASEVVLITVTAGPGPATATNVATVSSSGTPDPDGSNDSVEEDTTIVSDADLSISKTDSADPVGTDSLLTYRLTATNHRPSSASGVVIQDTLPGGVTLFSRSPSCSLDGPLFCALRNLNVGQSKQVTVTVLVDALPGTTLTNTASVSGDQSDPNGSNNSTVELTAVQLNADLSVELVHSPEVPFFGLPMNILATFRNLGPKAAINVGANILLPSVFTVGPVTSAFSCSSSGSQILCSFGIFQPGETASASITATPGQGGNFTVSGSINSLSTDPVPGNNSDTIMFNIPDNLDLSIVKTARFDIAASGRPFWYEIEVENLGNGPFADILVTDDLPAGLQVNGVTTEGPIACTESPTSVSCEIDALNPGEVMSFLLEVQVAGGLVGPFVNTAEATAEGDQDEENNSSTAPAMASAPGDANADGAFNAADIVLIILEINDLDGEDVFEADGGSFKGNPAMDVNGDELINLDDYDALLPFVFPPAGSPLPSGQEPEDQE